MKLSELINYQFDSPALLELALTHRSAGGNNNERLEFLGDAILGMVISDWLYKRFQAASEGQLSRLRASLVKRETLASLARELDIGKYLEMGVGEQRSGGHSRDSILADAIEAIIAAVYLDGGIDKAHKLILSLFDSRLQAVDLNDCGKDSKTRLQEYLQARNLELPEYEILRTEGKQHHQTFTVQCNVKSLQLTSEGIGRSRRKAEQAAAAALLEQVDAE
ncbi:ribonuclease III [Solemya velum gill symbiont]|nr:ribonuclease III [Solemya velum gill symbiont]